jgi:hypothetical protein
LKKSELESSPENQPENPLENPIENLLENPLENQGIFSLSHFHATIFFVKNQVKTK